MSNENELAATEVEAVEPEVENEGAATAAAYGDESTDEDQQAEADETFEAESDEVSEISAEDEGEGDEGRKPPGKRRFKKRIDQLQRKIGERDQFIREMQERFAAEQSQPQAAPQIAEAPNRESYDDYEAYVGDLAVYKANEAIQQQTAVSKQAQQARVQAQAAQQFDAVKNAALQAGVEVYPDFEAVATNEDLPLTPTMAEAVLSSENAPHVWYYLGKNPNEAAKIARLQPMQQALAIGQLSSTVTAKASKQPSNAPAPKKPVNARGSAVRGPNDKQSVKAWIEQRNKELYG
jgi:hypothetical protein